MENRDVKEAQSFIDHVYRVGEQAGYDRAIEVLSNYGSEDVKKCIRLLRELDVALDSDAVNVDDGFYPPEDQRLFHLDTCRAT